MEPLQNDTAPDAPDQGLDDAASALESQLPPGAADDLPAQPAAPSPQQARPGRDAWHTQWRGEKQANYLKRLADERRQHAATAAEKRRYEEQLATNAKTMESVKELLAKKFPAEVEQIDLLEPGSADKLAALLKGRTDEAIKPLLEWVQRQQEKEAREAEQAELQAAQQEAQESLTAEYQAELREYTQASPYAFGVEDRVRSWISYKAGIYERAGYEPQDAQTRAMIDIHAHFEHNRRQGVNGIEAVDRFVCSEFDALGFDPVDPEDDLEGVWGGGQQPAAPPPPRTEAGRLARVQQRTRGASATGPRAPERVSTEQGELATLVQAGETDMRKLQQAALHDAGGDQLAAAKMLSQAFAMPLQW